MNQKNVWPVTKFPWLTSDEVKRLEEYTAGLSWMEKIQKQTELYKEVIDYKQQEKYKENRTAAINENYYRGATSDNKVQKKKWATTTRQEQLADMWKEYYKIPYETDTETVLKWIIKDAQLKWVWPELLDNYINKWDETFLYKMWYKKSNVAKNVVWWVLDAITWLPKLAWKLTAEWVWKAAKALWADEDKVDYWVNDFKNYMDNEAADIWQDKSSLTYKWTNVAWDMALLLAWQWWAKVAAKSAPILQKISNLGKATDEVVREFPVLWKLLSYTAKKWTQWAADTILFNAINWETTDLWEATEWGAINIWLWALWNLVPSKEKVWKLAKKLETSWLVNAKTLEAVNNSLKRAWESDMPDVKAGWEWLLTRWFKGTKDWLRKDLNEWHKTFSQAKKEILSQAKTEVESPAAKESLDWLINAYKWKVWGEKYVKDLELIKTKDTFNAQELDNILWAIDDAWLHIYTSGWAEADRLAAKIWSDRRRAIKEQVEKIAKDEWLWDIWAINREIQIAHAFENWIYGKQLWDEVSNIANSWWPIAQIYSTAINTVTSTAKATKFANLLRKFSWLSKKDMTELLWENGEFSQELLEKIIKWNEWSIDKFSKEFKALFPSKSTELAVSWKMKKPASKTKKKWQSTGFGKDLIRKALLFSIEDSNKKD